MTNPEAATAVARQAAVRRLALTILGLDVPSLTAELQLKSRQQPPLRLPQARPVPARRVA
jgi:hypothetical protein